MRKDSAESAETYAYVTSKEIIHRKEEIKYNNNMKND